MEMPVRVEMSLSAAAKKVLATTILKSLVSPAASIRELAIRLDVPRYQVAEVVEELTRLKRVEHTQTMLVLR